MKNDVIKLDKNLIAAAEKALAQKKRVELLIDKDGQVIAQSVDRRRLKTE